MCYRLVQSTIIFVEKNGRGVCRCSAPKYQSIFSVRRTSKLSIITNFYKHYATLSLMHLKRFQHLKELESFILNPLNNNLRP